ncbi:hypothetical protein PUNSTDRAFT_40906 [Punctularia strigosozonata HHB-11173 SS5]|uniref:uncharacterized protein n=1 Tax=Punctularia strigosozonata (strain HHB-11173) TaxID=741275 RepID=UPI0004417DBA|nr:uncharacterized protein PUNSTDRAFT_40906 [Punctularia strigosozonata HHB-11173 SS5]EIN13246.1 hypothetical protein PUNSTDRAFT_40906 [Punctularia strigosozonata HHB-11173 SS5]
MRAHLPLALAVLAASEAAAADSLFSRTSNGLARAHHAAIRRSAGLARDLRTAFRGLLVEQHGSTQVDLVSHSVYCVSAPKSTSPAGNGLTGGGNGTASAGGSSSTAKATSTKKSGASATSTKSGASATATSEWKVFQQYQGDDFFNGWTFWDTADPTNAHERSGIVDFQSQSDAESANLTSINSAGNAIMRVDTTAVVTGNRKAIRITTNAVYTGGLVILDAVHMPTGCGTWPAFWSNGPNWPAGGEIDIVEGVNDYTNNQATIHTNPGCSLATDSSSALGITGTIVGGTDCAAADSGNQGCGVRSADTSSYGAAFNNIGGGVYAMLWNDTGISVYFFRRSNIPSDITSGAPNPAGWGTPMANWPSTQCDTSKFFSHHSVIFDTTLCGDWAGGVWSSSGIPGQEQSCAQRTGVSDCATFVRNNGASFAEAYWEVKSVTIYQTS